MRYRRYRRYWQRVNHPLYIAYLVYEYPSRDTTDISDYSITGISQRTMAARFKRGADVPDWWYETVAPDIDDIDAWFADSA